jgi:hypothetical protein
MKFPHGLFLGFILLIVLFEKSTSQTTIQSTITTIPNPTETPVQPSSNSTDSGEKLLLGFTKFSIENKILSFLMHFRLLNSNRPPIIKVVIYIVYSLTNLRNLEDGVKTKLECTLIEETTDKEVFQYECKKTDLDKDSVSKVIIDEDSIKIDGVKVEATPAAAYLKDKLVQLKGNDDLLKFFVKPTIPMNNCEIKVNRANNLTIEGDINESIEGKDTYAIIIESDNSTYKNLTGKLYKYSNKYRFTTSPGEKFEASFDNQLVNYDNNNNIIFNFASSNSSEVINEAIQNDLGRQKKSAGGLSGGTVVAIVIPCAIALIAIAGAIFILTRPKSQAIRDIGNNTIGVNSGTNIQG